MKLRIIIKYIKTIQGWTISLNRFYLLCHRIYGLHRDQAPARELRYWLRLFLTHKTLGISSNKRSFLWRLHSLRHFCEHCCSLQAVRLFHCPGKKNFLSNLINFLFFFGFQVGNVDNQNGQKIRTKRFIGHPSYNGNLIIKDYGVIELSSSITMNSFTQPIPVKIIFLLAGEFSFST